MSKFNDDKQVEQFFGGDFSFIAINSGSHDNSMATRILCFCQQNVAGDGSSNS